MRQSRKLSDLLTSVLEEAVRKLEADQRSPADLMLAEGIRGVCGNPYRCVMAEYFNAALASVDAPCKAFVTDNYVYAVPDEIASDSNPCPVHHFQAGVPLPVRYCELIEDFDLGRLPQLILQGAA